MLSQAILAVLAVIESLVPMLGTSAATAQMITSIIDALTKLLPFIITEISTVYTSVKNIISLLQTSGAPMTPDQQTALQQLDSQVDAAWNDVESKIDPDAPGGDPATKTS